MENAERIMEMMRTAWVRYCEVISQGVDHDYDSLVERFGMPASILMTPRGLCGVVWKNRARRLFVEDQTCQQKAFCEKIYSNGVKDALLPLAKE